jgi:hypothetical protein
VVTVDDRNCEQECKKLQITHRFVPQIKIIWGNLRDKVNKTHLLNEQADCVNWHQL